MLGIVGVVVAYLDGLGTGGDGYLSLVLGLLPLEVFVNDDQVPQVFVEAQAAQVHVEACHNGRDAHLVSEFRVVVPDDAFLEMVGVAGVFRNHVVYPFQVAHLGTALVVSGGDVYQDVLGGLEVEVVQERAFEGALHGYLQAVVARAFAAAHQGHAGIAHHLAHVLEVHVDVAGFGNHLDNALDGGGQHLIGLGEGFLDEGVAEELVQLLVVDYQEAVHVLFQFMDAVNRLGLAFVAFVLEGDGDHGHREDAAVLGHFGNDGGGSRSGAAAHAGGEEEHLGAAVQHLAGNLVLAFYGCVAARGGVRAGSQAVLPHLNLHGYLTYLEGLRVGVAHDKAAALDILAVHVVDGVAASAAYAYHFDNGILVVPVGRNNGLVVIDTHNWFSSMFSFSSRLASS